MHHVVHGQHVHAVDLHAGDACRDGLLSERLRTSLKLARHGNGVLVVLDKEHHGEIHGAREVHAFVKVALARAAVARVRHGHALFTAQLEREADARRLDDLRTDDDLRHHTVDAFRNFAAKLVSAGVKEELMQRIPVEVQLRDVAIAWEQEVFFLRGELAADHGRFLAGHRRVKSQASLPGQANCALIPDAREDHALHELAQVVVRQLRDQVRVHDVPVLVHDLDVRDLKTSNHLAQHGHLIFALVIQVASHYNTPGQRLRKQQ